MYKTVYTEVEVDVDLGDFDTDDLLDELESRGELPVDGDGNARHLVDAIWLKRRSGQNFDRELDQLIYQVTGKII